VKIAACQYHIDLFDSWDAYAEHLTTLCEAAAGEGAELLLLPEYAGLVLSGQLPPAQRGDLQASIDGIQPLLPAWRALCADLARRLGVYLQPGSVAVRDADGQYRNRAWFYGPDGELGHQDKLMMTRFEREHWHIAAGQGLRVFDTAFGRLGILICYDNEFPLLARTLAEGGADLILAPSCTDTEAGATRVRVGCLARALENRVFVAQSVTAGEAPWSPALDINTGEAAIFAPMDRGLPADGVVAQTTGDQVWAIAELDLDALDRSRADAQVANDRDWMGQLKPAVARAKLHAW